MWLSVKSACLAHVRLWVPSPVPKEKRQKKKLFLKVQSCGNGWLCSSVPKSEQEMTRGSHGKGPEGKEGKPGLGPISKGPWATLDGCPLATVVSWGRWGTTPVGAQRKMGPPFFAPFFYPPARFPSLLAEMHIKKCQVRLHFSLYAF
jgi:hypothetical protein